MTQPTYLDALLRASGVSNFIQGEVLAAEDACVTLADASAPLSDEASRIAAEEGSVGLIVVPTAVDNVVLLTQTCDLQATTEDEFTCLVAPVFNYTQQFAYEAWRGRRPGFAGLPWVSDTAAADLSRVTSVERSVLIGVESLGHPRNLQERIHFAETVGRYLMRPALPNKVSLVLKPFVTRISERHDRNSAEGYCINNVAEFRVEATPDIDHDDPALNVLMLIDESELPSLGRGEDVDNARIDALASLGNVKAAEAVIAATTAVRKREAWTALAECWILPSVARVPAVDGVAGVEITVLNGEELSYARSLNAPRLDLQYLSTRAA
jgi:hypothetical protein